MRCRFVVVAVLVAAGGSAACKPEVEPTATVSAVLETDEAHGLGDAADDTAIWVHPTDPTQSLVIGTSKQSGGGVAVYGLDGRERSFVASGMANNVDNRTGFVLDGAAVDLVAVSNKGTRSIDHYIVDGAGSRLVPAGSIALSEEPYGLCMAQTGEAFSSIVNYKSGRVEQYELSGAGTSVTGRLVRTFTTQAGEQSEGCHGDDGRQLLYQSIERVGAFAYPLGADAGEARTRIDVTTGGGHLTADVEGIAVWEGPDGTGHVIVSSQGDSTLAVYDRQTFAYEGSFRVGANGAVDEVTSTDGVSVTSADLGGRFSSGLLVVHDGSNTGGIASNFKYVAWSDVVNALDLDGDPPPSTTTTVGPTSTTPA